MVKLCIAGLAASLTLHAAHAATDRYNITPAEHAACDGDAERLCLSAYPDETRLMGCMKTNILQLTPICLTTFEAGMKRRHIGF